MPRRASRLHAKDHVGHPPPVTFGDLITADHLVSIDEESLGSDGERFAFAMVDAATRWHACAPSAGNAMNEFRSDNAPELIAAAKSLGWIRESSTPRASETNAIAERAVRTVVEGARTLLSQARLPPATWPHAEQCLLHTNVQLSKGKWEERAVDGMMLGYHQRPGGRWSGDFIVAEIPGSPRGGDAPEQPRIFRVADAHNVKGQPWEFPMAVRSLTDTTLEDWQSVDEELDDVPDEGGDASPEASPRVECDASLRPETHPAPSPVNTTSSPSTDPAPGGADAPRTPPRGGNAPEDVKVWIRHDSNAKALRTTLTKGPRWSTVVRRITKGAKTHEVLADEVVNGDEPDYHIRWSEPVPGGHATSSLNCTMWTHLTTSSSSTTSCQFATKPYTTRFRPASYVGRPTPSARWASRPMTGAA